MYRRKKPDIEEEEPIEKPTVQEMPMKEEKPSGLMARM